MEIKINYKHDDIIENFQLTLNCAEMLLFGSALRCYQKSDCHPLDKRMAQRMHDTYIGCLEGEIDEMGRL